MPGISTNDLQTGAAIAIKAAGWIYEYIKQRNLEKENKQHHEYNDIFDEFLQALSDFGYHSNKKMMT